MYVFAPSDMNKQLQHIYWNRSHMQESRRYNLNNLIATPFRTLPLELRQQIMELAFHTDFVPEAVFLENPPFIESYGSMKWHLLKRLFPLSCQRITPEKLNVYVLKVNDETITCPIEFGEKVAIPVANIYCRSRKDKIPIDKLSDACVRDMYFTGAHKMIELEESTRFDAFFIHYSKQ